MLKDVAAILKIPMEAIQNFDEQQAVNVIANTYTFQDFKDNAVASGFSYQPSFNPLDKLSEAYDEIKRLNAEIIKLKDEQIKLLQSLLDQK